MSDKPLLHVHNLSVSYGKIKAVRGISFEVYEGQIVALIGANGAGKSTTLRAISRMVAYSGHVAFKGQDLKGTAAHRLPHMGLAHVPEGRGIFGNLTVMENLKLATWHRKDKHEMAEDSKRVFSLFPVLYDRKEQSGGTLSGGEQQMLALGRALMSRGKLLLLDEPSMGLAPMLVRNIFSVLSEINRTGTTILLVEQNAYTSLRAASYAYVLETGTISLSGTGAELLDNPLVREAYLGSR
jgi:branched-chain amino acid transport system ATP-binding protein